MALISIQSILNRPSVSEESLSPTPNPPSLICRALTPPDTLPPLRYGYKRIFSNKAETAASRHHVRAQNTPLPTLPAQTLVRTYEGSMRIISCPEVPAITCETRVVCPQTEHNSEMRGRRLSVPWHSLIQHPCASTHAYARINPSIHP
jgi:hypothetical protein